MRKESSVRAICVLSQTGADFAMARLVFLGLLAWLAWPLALKSPTLVTRDPRGEESAATKVAAGSRGACGQALAAGQQRFEESRQQWLSERCLEALPMRIFFYEYV